MITKILYSVFGCYLFQCNTGSKLRASCLAFHVGCMKIWCFRLLISDIKCSTYNMLSPLILMTRNIIRPWKKEKYLIIGGTFDSLLVLHCVYFTNLIGGGSPAEVVVYVKVSFYLLSSLHITVILR